MPIRDQVPQLMNTKSFSREGTETTAELRGDHYILNGEKIFITNGGEADTYVIFAVTTPGIGTKGISAFIVEKGWEGFEFGDHYDKMGIRSSTTAELIFNDVKVPKLHKEAATFKSKNIVPIIPTSPTVIVKICGVLNFLVLS